MDQPQKLKEQIENYDDLRTIYELEDDENSFPITYFFFPRIDTIHIFAQYDRKTDRYFVLYYDSINTYFHGDKKGQSY